MVARIVEEARKRQEEEEELRQVWWISRGADCIGIKINHI